MKFDGTNITLVLQGDTSWPDRTLFEQQQSAIFPDKKGNKFCVRTQKWRLFGSKLIDIENDRQQKNNLAKEFPEVVKRLRAEYEAWYDELEPSFSDLSHIVVGNPAENPSVLTCHDWDPEGKDLERLLKAFENGGRAKLGVPWLQMSVSGGALVNGFWRIDVEKSGQYQVELRRWPREEDKPMVYGGPVAGTNSKFEQERIRGVENPKRKDGRAIKMDRARLKIGDIYDESVSFGKDEHCVIFNVTLPAGKTQLQTWLWDSKGKKENRGAYYVYIHYAST